MKKLLALALFCMIPLVLQAQEIEFQRVNIEIDAGWGYRLGPVEAEDQVQKDYLNGLRSGVAVGGAFFYYLRHTLGLGLKYSFFYANNESGEYWDKTYFNYIGPAFNGKTPTLGKSNIKLCYTASLGYLHYRDRGYGMTINNQAMEGIITAQSLGIYTDFGAEFRLSNKVYFAAKIYLLGGVAYNAELSTAYGKEKFEIEDGENLSRFGISAGLKIGL